VSSVCKTLQEIKREHASISEIHSNQRKIAWDSVFCELTEELKELTTRKDDRLPAYTAASINFCK
jgi:hypothetical protein